jgi:hypothetical protein
MFEGSLCISEVQKICEVIYTNNSKVNRNYIEQIYLQYFPSHLFLAILLDIYYAKARIIKEINKFHPDFRVAKQNLTIFLQLSNNMALIQHQRILLRNLKTDVASIPSFMQH